MSYQGDTSISIDLYIHFCSILFKQNIFTSDEENLVTLFDTNFSATLNQATSNFIHGFYDKKSKSDLIFRLIVLR